MKEKKSAFSAREAIRVGLHLTVVAIFCHGLAQIFTDFKTQSVKLVAGFLGLEDSTVYCCATAISVQIKFSAYYR
jgi:hypothetical protein